MPIHSIMLVDDDPDIRFIAELALSKVGGWFVTLAASGPDALTKLDSGTPDVILLDVMMPGMDGPTVFRHLRTRSELTETPIIFMTAKTQDKEIAQYLSLGAAGVVSKPFDPMTLPDQIRGIVNGA